MREMPVLILGLSIEVPVLVFLLVTGRLARLFLWIRDLICRTPVLGRAMLLLGWGLEWFLLGEVADPRWRPDRRLRADVDLLNRLPEGSTARSVLADDIERRIAAG